MSDGELIDRLRKAPPGLREAFIDSLSPAQAAKLLAKLGPPAQTPPATPLEQALELDSQFRTRPHLELISDRIASAMQDVARGQNRRLIINTPPRAGKSTLLSVWTPLWVLRNNPAAKVALLSYDVGLVTSWARTVRSLIEGNPVGVQIAPDGGAAASWSTVQGGGLIARSTRMPLTGFGASTLFIDDPVKDFAEAHSAASREALWNWWLSVAQTRLEPPFLCVTTLTRWHEDDLVGRMLSDEHEGNPDDWEVIRLPAIADSADDPLGRERGGPLLSPLLDEDEGQAAERWGQVRRDIGSYTWSALYQQSPAPAAGAIFDIGAFHYWTHDESLVSDTVHYLDPDRMAAGVWLDSWDAAFKGADDSDFVVGQRWVRVGPNRALVDQTRGRRTFTETIKEMERWSDPHLTRYARLVHKRVIEDKANGPAIIDTLRKKIAGIKPFDPRTSKEGRYRAVTPECESGNVWLPHPSTHPWVRDLLDELRDAPHGANDDQCLVGETLVETPAGPRRLDSIQTGEVVLGASGWVTVEAAGMTSPSADVVERCGLVGTPDHPVWTLSRGWAPLATIEYNDNLWILAQSKTATGHATPEGGARCITNAGSGMGTHSTPHAPQESCRSARTQTVIEPSPQRQDPDSAARIGYPGPAPLSNKSSTKGPSFAATPTHGNPATGATSSPEALTPHEASNRFTERSTRTTTDPSLTAGTSTTSTKTSTITTPAILRRSRPALTTPSTLDRLGLTGGPCSLTWHGSGRKRQSGIGPKKEGNGTDSTPSPRTSARSTEATQTGPGATTTGHVRLKGEKSFARPSGSDGVNVAPVFNLKTSDGTYFANGVLVHNCDAFAMALLEMRTANIAALATPPASPDLGLRAVPGRVAAANTMRRTGRLAP